MLKLILKLTFQCGVSNTQIQCTIKIWFAVYKQQL